MQDFTPFTPELLGALSGPQTPGHMDTSQSEVSKSLRDFTYSSRASFRVGISAWVDCDKVVSFFVLKVFCFIHQYRWPPIYIYIYIE